MPYTNTTAEFRPELQIKVEEAQAIDSSFICDTIFPMFPTMTRTGYYKRIKRGTGQLLAKAGGATDATDPLVRAPGTAYRETTRTTEQDNYLTVDRGLEEPVDDVNKQDESRFFDLESSTAIWLARNIRISREVRVAAIVQNPAIWGSFESLAEVDYTEANIATFDFATDLKAAKRLLLKRQETPNGLVLSQNLWDLITSSTLLRSYFFGANGGNAMIDEELIAKKFNLKYVLIGKTSYDTTKLGQESSDSNLQWAWNDNYFWVGNIVDGAPELGGAGRTFVLDPLTGGQLYVTETYREEKIRSDRLRVRQDDDTKVVNENSGILVQVNGF